MKIFLARNQVQAGPYTLEELNSMLATGQVELSDLMWHEGMAQWQTVGEMTNGLMHYTPHGSSATPTTDSDSERVSVADLYGKKEPTAPTQSAASSRSPFKIGNKPVKTTKAGKLAVKDGPFELASISSRIVAVIIDQALALLCLVPLLSGLNFDMDKLSAAAQDPALLGQLAESVPSHLALLSALLLLALFFVQIFMLIKRGQSIGKLITGVRILDVKSRKLPSITNLILMRTLLTNLAYNIPTIGQVILVVDFVMMIANKKRRSLHDKIAKTIVVKAEPSQLDKK